MTFCINFIGLSRGSRIIRIGVPNNPAKALETIGFTKKQSVKGRHRGKISMFHFEHHWILRNFLEKIIYHRILLKIDIKPLYGSRPQEY